MLLVLILNVILVIILGGWLLRGCLFDDGTGDTPEWKHRNLRIWKQTPVWDMALAVKHQNTTRIKKLAKIHPEWLNYQEPRFGATLLIWAVGVEKYQSAQALLQCGADPDIATTFAGETALYVAAGFSWIDYQAKTDPKYVKLLLKYGADPNIHYVGYKPIDGASDITDPGTSPLMRSIGWGIDKTKALVDGGAEINHKSISGRTAAILALSEGGFNVTDEMREYAYYLIVEKRANVRDPYFSDGLHPFSIENTNEKYYPVDLLRDWVLDMNTRGYRIKMEIVNEFARQGVDYWKTQIPDYWVQYIKKSYPNTWQEYIKKY